jgi:3-hydroxyacyl-CoA dehydrogenase
MIIESVPERVDVKVEVFGELDRLADDDAILCSNSSSLPSSQIIAKVQRPERVLNTHYQQPPELNSVELMSCGKTDAAIIDALMTKLPRYGLVPFRIEEHYASVREGLPEAPRKLLREYIDDGRLGVRSGRGFYDPAIDESTGE